MSKPSEHKTVQARILAYAEAIGWTIVSREAAERRRGLRKSMKDEVGRMKGSSLFFDDLLHGQLPAFNPLYQEAEGAGMGQWQAALFHHLILLSGLRLDCAVNPQEEAQKATCATKSGFCGAIIHFAPL